MVDLFAGVSVSDYAGALAWYEKLLGSPPAFSPNDVEAVWQLDEHRFLYVEHRPAHAGHALHTLFVDDLDARLAGIAERGLEPVDLAADAVRDLFGSPVEGSELGVPSAPPAAVRSARRRVLGEHIRGLVGVLAV